jgi:hypothetical protein
MAKTPNPDIAGALAHIAARYPHDIPAFAVHQVAMALQQGQATAADCLWSLALVDAAKRELDLAELQVTDFLINNGVSWSQIAAALGITGLGAANRAKSRYKTLGEKYPQ